MGDSLVLGVAGVEFRSGDAHLDSQRQLGVDAVSGLCSLLRCHCDGIWRGIGRWSKVVVGRLAAEVGGSRIRLVRVCKSSSPARASAGAGGPPLSKRPASCAYMLRDT